jgi:S-DNA-T family DNA segregation ATPase FtsK/SpoIIIE
MEKRYKLFAAAGVRDLNGYNALAETWLDENGEPEREPLPRLVIIVDELADLMMVAKSEVESAICRLAQLARAAGIHLIIATQRPSVDVITGLIKANMPSRIAFAVSSQVDSRTILDMAGAEKLIGRGDMLFYPQNYQKPARIQGAFVSDEEVTEVVKYIREHNESDTHDEKIDAEIDNIAVNGLPDPGAGDVKADPARDEHFVEAGRFIIEKNKASIGLLQRVFKIGFNRAARIMDQLAEAGVVSEESSTRARQVLMTLPEFEAYLENES